MCLALAGCDSAPRVSEPLNLTKAKAAVEAYQDSGAYVRDLTSVADEARAWIEKRAAARAPGERLAVVFDVDETLLSNAPLMRRIDYAYILPEWDKWVVDAEAPAIEPVCALYRRCRELGLETFIITGRRDPGDREPTALNLRRRGIDGWRDLILAKPEQKGIRTADRKAASRAAIERDGYRIIANIGDQDSDLRGGHSERGFKLQNPFYLME